MRKRYHLCLLCLPVLIAVVLIAYYKVGQVRSDAHFIDAGELTWVSKGVALRAQVQQRDAVDDDARVFEIAIRDDAGATYFEEAITVYRDFGGDGVVKGMQVDADPEPELVFATNTGQGFFVDLSSGEVVKAELSALSPEVRTKITDWLRFHLLNPFLVGAFVVISLAWCLLYFPVFWLARAIVRRVSRNRSSE